MMRVLYDSDANLNLIKERNVLIVGYGSQGHAHANNLNDSGVKNVKVGLREGSSSRAKAEAAGLVCVTPSEGAAWADLVMILVPDELQADLWRDELAAHMKPGAALAFAHGLNIHFGLIEPPASLDYDRAQGSGALVRSEYSKAGVPTLIAVHQDASGNARTLRLLMLRRTVAVAPG